MINEKIVPLQLKNVISNYCKRISKYVRFLILLF